MLTRSGVLCCLALVLASCATAVDYTRIPIADRRLNLSGLAATSTQYLNEHPEDFYKFHRILTAADDALSRDAVRTRAGVVRWLDRAVRTEGYDDRMPVYLFVRTAYLNGWERSWFGWVGESDREYLYDLVSAVMAGMHLCTTCSTAREEAAP
ncbi:MAG: hypothetical protein ACOYXU_05710 [Nitrospirota bacterium]